MSEISNLGETLRTVIPSSVRTGLPAYPSYASGYVSPIAQAKGSLLPTALKGAAPSSGGGMLNNVVLGLKAKWYVCFNTGYSLLTVFAGGLQSLPVSLSSVLVSVSPFTCLSFDRTV